MIHAIPTIISRQFEKQKEKTPPQEATADLTAGLRLSELLRESLAQSLESAAQWLRQSSKRRVPGEKDFGDARDRISVVRGDRNALSGSTRGDRRPRDTHRRRSK